MSGGTVWRGCESRDLPEADLEDGAGMAANQLSVANLAGAADGQRSWPLAPIEALGRHRRDDSNTMRA